ncbi:inositol monophosphatase [Candidatus Woesearchaeota archaeon]|nr:inositol monophosphatase [Candidatus Woesearchaeota archaeon]
MNDYKHFRQTALLAAKRASKILLQYYGKNGSVKQKPNRSLVSIADTEANKSIISIIKRNFPTHSILSEETGFEDNNSDYKWVIDPLDGTHNFLHKLPIFGTSIALEYKNEVILGVLHFPILCINAVAEKGKGAFVNGKKISVSSRKNLGYSFVLVDTNPSNRKKAANFIGALSGTTADIRNFGSAIYNIFLVACGKCEGYVILSTNEWDVAAGFLTVEEAGGRITNLDGWSYNFNERKYLVSNGKLHGKLLEFLK